MLLLFLIIGILGKIVHVLFWGLYIIWGIFYLTIVLRSHTFQYLRNINTTETVLAFMDRMYATKPTVTWSIQCYHYETRTRQVRYTVTYYVGNQQHTETRYRTETYQERVNTHAASGALQYTRWEDVSVPLCRDEIIEYVLTKVSIKKTWIAGDTGAREQKEDFIRYNNRDEYYDFFEDFELHGFRSRFLGLTDLAKRPCLAHWFWYLVAHTLVVFALPYLMWMSSVTGKVRTTVLKKVYTQCDNDAYGEYSC
jgi:hypothetical protein